MSSNNDTEKQNLAVSASTENNNTSTFISTTETNDINNEAFSNQITNIIDQKVDTNNNNLIQNNKTIIIADKPIIPIIPSSAYSLRVLPNVYSQSQTSYQPTLVEYETQTQSAPQWHSEHLPQSTTYLATTQSFITTNQQPTTLTPQIYSIDSNTDQLPYEQFTHYHPNIAYSYTNTFQSPISVPQQWSAHPVNTYSFTDNLNNSTTNTNTSLSSTNTNNKQHCVSYEYSKEKSKHKNNDSYHYVINSYSKTNNLAQNHTDNGFLPFNYYTKNSLSQIKDSVYAKQNGNNSYDFKQNPENKRQFKKFDKNNDNHQHQSNNRKRYSELSNKQIKTNETSSSTSPAVPLNHSNQESFYQRESNNLVDYNNNNNNDYSNFYNMTFNHLSYYNQFANKPAQYYQIEHEMANMNLSIMPNYYSYSYGEHSLITSFKNDPYDPKEFFITGEQEGIKKSKFFVIKSYSKNDVVHCIQYGMWCSTLEGNKKLDKAFQECENDNQASVYLFYSINGSGQFCGMAQMMSRVDYTTKIEIWSQDKWQGKFDVKWVYIKDVPNTKLRHIVLANNENKPVTNSRDTQEIFYEDAIRVLDVFRQHAKKSSILDEKGLKLLYNKNTTTNEINKFNTNSDKKKYFN